ncbi:MAG: primosomal protein N' [Elusimicrobia bacterium GWA2_61_42]|nr:MAG: primosomal protein N' [Elusimicrobia bacterium GWA2_61_42]OGR80317.1 MAG: primosomal protein N' [Elusimicrobia bacterium GWC2_61_25]
MLAEISFPIPLRKTFYYLLPEALELEAAPGLRVLASFGKREAVGVLVRVLSEKDADLTRFRELKTITRLLDENPLFPEDALALSAWMAGRWGSPPGLCLGAFYAHAPKEPPPAPPPAPPALPAAAPDLPEIKNLLAALAGKAGAYLLRLAALERRELVYPAVFSAALRAEGAQGLLLVPDLNFIPPLAAALEAVFPGRVGVWHARLTPKKRAEAWAGALAGRFKVLIATRTGVFLPFKDLKLGVMDGEHEEIYKQAEAEPYYHAREVLLKRMAALGGSCLLASPCPSIEAWGAAAGGRLQRFDAVPPAPVSGPGPDVRVLDMAQYPGDILARPLADSLRAAVAAGGQALIIAGRKGYASRLFCANCGWMPRCPDCGPGMTLLKTGAAGGPVLLCRRCGKKDPKPETCPKCAGKVFRDYGAGSQKTQEFVSRLLPGAKVARFDGDVLRGSLKTMRSELDSFSKGETDVLVGTRIALRELGAPRLSLLAFVDADSDLSSADFRASEKAYQAFYGAWRLLGAKGELFIQTREAGHYVFSRLNEMDYPSFADGELAARKDFFYPPFSHIVKARFASYDGNALDAAAADFLRALSFLGAAGDASEILGPVTPPGQEKRKFHSEYYLVKAASEAAAALCLEKAMALPQRQGVKYFIEADPYGF